MSWLTEGLPLAVEIGGERVPVATDFRAGLLFDALLWEKDLPDAVKVLLGLRLFYGERADGLNVGEAWRKVVWFYGGGEDDGRKGGGKVRRVVDFAKDAPLVYAGVLGSYGVDLAEIKGLHWWRFRAMVAGLGPQSALGRVMGLRAMDVAKVKDSGERARLARARERVRIEGMDGDVMQRAGALFGGA